MNYHIEDRDVTLGNVTAACEARVILTSNGAIHERSTGYGSNYDIARANAYRDLCQKLVDCYKNR